ncbi:hypothetical protein OQY15_10775 [Pedobacter sp. MC2016-15]|jgi:hypothetical protein|uniref:hypothetical protein n=1 Tax=Pedobacter sp. MC2016-15 TaxID=2994473 RepID=UPI0022458D5D|nr:hypothetical protein [Pedobacter sp. MC2016-15]MCX2479574.1 hypothetical protein [Pedobacter sp. MC2016-15]
MMVTNYSCPNWLNASITKVSNQPNYHFQIHSSLQIDVNKDFVLSPALNSRLGDFSNLIAVYLKKGQYKKERLRSYQSERKYLELKSCDISTQVICKIKLISNPDVFDRRCEQAMGLTLGIISRVQKNGFFKMNIISERYYDEFKTKFESYESYELVHLITMKSAKPEKP